MRRMAGALSGALLVAIAGLAAGCGGGHSGTSTPQPSSSGQAATTTSAEQSEGPRAKRSPNHVKVGGVVTTGRSPHRGSRGGEEGSPAGGASTSSSAVSPSTSTTEASGSESNSPPVPTGRHGNGGKPKGTAKHTKRPPSPSARTNTVRAAVSRALEDRSRPSRRADAGQRTPRTRRQGSGARCRTAGRCSA